MTTLLRCTILILGTLATSAHADWLSDYRYALESMERGQFNAAIDALNKAIAAKPNAELGTAADGHLDYLPHLNLAVAYYEAGELEKARQSLQQSQLEGVATQSFLGSRLWDRYSLPIMASDPTVAETQSASFREYPDREHTLSDAEAAEIRSQVLRRCALSAKVAANSLPWYFHYEFGLELMRSGDAQRALDALILAANLREDSKRNSRMYGMWFTDYLPYYQIARAHSKLGNWQCAMDAMRISAKFSEFSPTDSGYQDYSDLQKIILRQQEKSAADAG